jgi:hypothetical protein
MESEFLTAVDAAVAQALPVDWPRVPQHRLPHCGGTRARHAFRRRGGQGAASYLAVVAVPAAEPHPGALDGELAALVELVLARGAGLLLLYEANAAHADWLLDHLAFPHSHLLTVACTRVPAPAAGPAIPSEPYSAEPTWSGREPLSRTLHDLWTGALFYDGPQEGPQTVGVECLRDVCWRCSRPLATITGIVFPDRAVADWAHPEWAYYQQLAEVAALPEPVIAALAAAVDSWRALGETRLTPIRWRYSKTVAHSYWAAECPGCGAFRGAVPVLAERLPHLASLASRRTGALCYRPLHLEVPRQLLHDLIWACEVTPHARPLGWRRAAEAPNGLAMLRHHKHLPAGALCLPSPPPRNDSADGTSVHAAGGSRLASPPLPNDIALPAQPSALQPPPQRPQVSQPWQHSQPSQRSLHSQPAKPWRRFGQALATWLQSRRSA